MKILIKQLVFLVVGIILALSGNFYVFAQTQTTQTPITAIFEPTGTTSPSPNFTVKLRVNPSGSLTLGIYAANIIFTSAVQVTEIRYLVGGVSSALGGDSNNLSDVNSRGFIKLRAERPFDADMTIGANTDLVEMRFAPVAGRESQVSVITLDNSIDSGGYPVSYVVKIQSDGSQILVPLSAATFRVNPTGVTPTLSPTPTGAPATPTPTLAPQDVTCAMTLGGLTQQGANELGGPVYDIVAAGDNKPITLQFTPSNATVTVTPGSPSGAPVLRINEPQAGVRIAQIPANDTTSPRIYEIRANIASGTRSALCLIRMNVAAATSNATCPATISSTEVKFNNPDGTGTWVTPKTISAGGSVRVAGFHNVETSPAQDILLTVTGPLGFASTVSQGATFTPPSDLPSGLYTFTARTKNAQGTLLAGEHCIGSGNLTVSPSASPTLSPSPTGLVCIRKPNGNADGVNGTDLRDFNIWRDERFGRLGTKTADFDCSGVVDDTDLEFWIGGYTG